ncbi:MAG: GIY-YIG nuclease family protein, partial [Methylovirgula sp.]
RERSIPERSGCYVLTNFSNEVMYVGLARNLRRRFSQHLDSDSKVATTAIGRAILFFWYETLDINKVERTWMNIYIQHEGSLPRFNKVYSPVA